MKKLCKSVYYDYENKILTFTSFVRVLILDFPSGTMLAFVNSTSHGDGGPCYFLYLICYDKKIYKKKVN